MKAVSKRIAVVALIAVTALLTLSTSVFPRGASDQPASVFVTVVDEPPATRVAPPPLTEQNLPPIVWNPTPTEPPAVPELSTVSPPTEVVARRADASDTATTIELPRTQRRPVPKHPWGSTSMWAQAVPPEFATSSTFKIPMASRLHVAANPDFCSEAQLMPHRVMVVHPPVDVIIPTVTEMREAVHFPELFEAWQNMSYAPSSHSPINPQERASDDQCRYRGAVIGMAVYPSIVTAPFVKSFQTYGAGACNRMILFAREPPIPRIGIYERNSHVVEFENYTKWEERVRAEGAPVRGVEMMRSAILALWIEDQLRPGTELRFTHIVQADTRDTVFMDDPIAPLLRYDLFRRLNETWTTPISEQWLDLRRHLPTAEFVFVLPEDTMRVAEPQGIMINNRWIAGVAGWRYDHLLRGSTAIVSNAANRSNVIAARCVNPGVYGGTPVALLNFLRLFAVTQEFAAEGFGYDQGALHILVYGALYAARFPHPVLMLDTSRTAYRHQYTIGFGPNFIRWDADGSHRNCDNERYAIVHQLDRYPEAWLRVQIRYLDAAEDYCRVARIPGSTDAENVTGAPLLTVVHDPKVPHSAVESIKLEKAMKSIRGIFAANMTQAEDIFKSPMARAVKPSETPTCPRSVSVVTSIAGLSPDEIRAVVQSFQRHAVKPCDAMHIVGALSANAVINRSDAAATVTMYPDLAAGVGASTADPHGALRFEALRNVIRLLAVRGELGDVVLVVDARESVFMSSMSSWLARHRHRLDLTIRDDFLLLSTEASFLDFKDQLYPFLMIAEVLRPLAAEGVIQYLADRKEHRGSVPLHAVTPAAFLASPRAADSYLRLWATLMRGVGHKPWVASHRAAASLLAYVVTPWLKVPFSVGVLSYAKGPFHGLLPHQSLNDAAAHRSSSDISIDVNCEGEPYVLALDVSAYAQEGQQRLRGPYVERFF